MKTFCFLVFLFLISSCADKSYDTSNDFDSAIQNSQVKNDSIIEYPRNWLSFEYDEARIYLYGLDANSEFYKNPDIIVDGQLNTTVLNKEGIALKENQIDRINNILSGKQHEDEGIVSADCFIPHHGIVFYKSQKPVGHISICLMCHRMKSFPESPYLDAEKFRPIIEETNLPIFEDPGNATEYYKTILIDSNELKTFWEKNLMPLVKGDKNKFIQQTHFPLKGDWGYMMQLDKPEDQWTKDDFMNGFDKLFNQKFIDKLKTLSHKDMEVRKIENEELEFLVSASFEDWVDEYKDEWTIILRFKKINGEYKLYMINGAG